MREGIEQGCLLHEHDALLRLLGIDASQQLKQPRRFLRLDPTFSTAGFGFIVCLTKQ
jgi:hypothetical protein